MKGHSLKAWFLATRPWSFPASAMPVLVTLAYLQWLQRDVDWLVGLWALANVVLFHAAANTWSDYFDFKKGVDREDTVGGTSLTSGEFRPKEIFTLATVLMALSVASGVLLLLCTGLPTLYIGLAGCLFILLYPWLKYHALGDVDIFITYSILPILGTSYVATGYFFLEVMWLTIPVGLITVGILHINNTRDIEQDRRAGITTFAMLAGGTLSVLFYFFEIIFPFVWVVYNIVYGFFPWWSLLVLIALVPAIACLVRAVRFLSGGAEELYGVDEMTAKLQLVFSLLFTISFLVAGFLG